MEQKPFCKKCLLKEMSEERFKKELADYLDSLEEEEKASGQLYEERFSVCKQCDYLNAGMCKACGCYVEMRAAMKARICPYGKW